MQSSSACPTHTWFVFALIFCAGLGGSLYGYDIGVISGALPFIKKTIQLTTHQLEVIVGAVLFGCLGGTMTTGSLADRFGRRTMILVACIVFTLGVLSILLSFNFITLLLARLLLGIGVGIIAVAVPLYLSEIAPAAWRGRSVSAFQIFLTLGVLLAYIVDYFFTSSGSWRLMFAVILLPALALFISMLILPETPRWLLAKSKQQKAQHVLTRIYSAERIEQYQYEIINSLQKTQNSWRLLIKPEFMLPLFIAVAIAVSNQLTGINAILQYAPLLMMHAGFHGQSAPMLATISIGTIQFIFTFVAMLLIDYVGRKRLLIIGTLGLVLVNFYLGAIGQFNVIHSEQAWLALGGLLAYFIFYAIGPGVVVWLAISELLPTQVRGKSVAICLFMNSLASALLSSVFLSIIHGIGMSYTYWLFALFSLLYFLIAFYLLPETKGRSLEQIQAHYQTE